MSKARYIYTLSDPRSGAVRYVGITTQPARRLRDHCSLKGRKGPLLRAWMRSILSDGVMPMFSIVDTTNADNWRDCERRWIAYFVERGHDLVNGRDGGDGPQPIERWSRDRDECIGCGRSDRRHAANGLCDACYNRDRHRRTKQPNRHYYEWSLDYPNCIECGTTGRPHKGHGLCENCFARRRIRLQPKPEPRWAREHDRCIECGTTDRAHRSHGLCSRCFGRIRYQQTVAKH